MFAICLLKSLGSGLSIHMSLPLQSEVVLACTKLNCVNWDIVLSIQYQKPLLRSRFSPLVKETEMKYMIWHCPEVKGKRIREIGVGVSSLKCHLALLRTHQLQIPASGMLSCHFMQGEAEDAFDHRIYTYQYRLKDRYGVDVVSLAVLADTNPHFRPNSCQHSRWGCSVKLSSICIGVW